MEEPLSLPAMLGLAVAVGGAVGLVRAIGRQNTVVPRLYRDPQLGLRVVFGFLEDVIIGAVAAVVIAAASDTNTLRGVIVVAAAGGWGGIAALEQVLHRLQIQGLTAVVNRSPSRSPSDGGEL